jgi:hypothetical protein
VRDRKPARNSTGLTAADGILRPPHLVQPTRSAAAAGLSPDIPPGLFSNRRSSEADGPPVVAALIDGYNDRCEDQHYAAKAAANVIESAEQQSQ